MSRKLSYALNVLLLGVLMIGLLGPRPATPGPRTRFATYAAPTFVPLEYSSHNNPTTKVCNAGADQAPSDQAGENKGDLDNGDGSFLTSVQLPHGARVRSLVLFANDNSADDVFLFLVRKRIKGGLAPQFNGYKVMASTRSDDAVENTMRRFVDRSVTGAVIDNKRFAYFLEMVECDVIEPFAAQIVYTT